MRSTGFWKQPLVPVGLVLCVIGGGNWWVSRGKVIEYSQRLEVSTDVDSSDLSGLAHLDSRTNASLLRRLRWVPDRQGVAGAKRDFYMLVNNGGRLIAIFGFALTSVGAIRLLGQRRLEQRRSA